MADQQAKIFIVDDDSMGNEMLSRYLTNKNPKLTVKSFLTGEECLKSLDEQPDLVILDYYLNTDKKSAANGVDILKEIKAWNKTLPVIMLSAQEDYTIAAQTIQYGAVHYVIKGDNAFQEVSELVEANI